MGSMSEGLFQPPERKKTTTFDPGLSCNTHVCWSILRKLPNSFGAPKAKPFFSFRNSLIKLQHSRTGNRAMVWVKGSIPSWWSLKAILKKMVSAKMTFFVAARSLNFFRRPRSRCFVFGARLFYFFVPLLRFFYIHVLRTWSRDRFDETYRNGPSPINKASLSWNFGVLICCCRSGDHFQPIMEYIFPK